jgi:hypothetical protein
VATAEFEWEREDPLAWVRGTGPAGESRKAHDALLEYAKMGSERSLRKLHERFLEMAAVREQWEQETVKQPSSTPQAVFGAPPPGPPTKRLSTINTWSVRHAWQARIARWEVLERRRALEKLDEERLQDRLKRIQVLQAYRSQLIKAMSLLGPGTADWKDVTSGLKLVTTELRREFGDDVEIHEVNLRGDVAQRVGTRWDGVPTEDLAAIVQNLLVSVPGLLPPAAAGEGDGEDA